MIKAPACVRCDIMNGYYATLDNNCPLVYLGVNIEDSFQYHWITMYHSRVINFFKYEWMTRYYGESFLYYYSTNVKKYRYYPQFNRRYVTNKIGNLHHSNRFCQINYSIIYIIYIKSKHVIFIFSIQSSCVLVQVYGSINRMDAIKEENGSFCFSSLLARVHGCDKKPIV